MHGQHRSGSTSEQVSVTYARHPASALKVAVVNAPRPVRIAPRIEPENDLSRFRPVGAIGVGVEQPKVDCAMAKVVVGHLVQSWRLVL